MKHHTSTKHKRPKYNRKRCSTKKCKSKKRQKGGLISTDISLAYPSNNVPSVSNPFLAHTQGGGKRKSRKYHRASHNKTHRVHCRCSKCKTMKGGVNNYIPLNTYDTDVQLEMIPSNTNPTFLGGGKSGKRSIKRQKGGGLSNFIGQDLINAGRQMQFNIGSTYNALSGYTAPINPLPWKDQMMNITMHR